MNKEYRCSSNEHIDNKVQKLKLQKAEINSLEGQRANIRVRNIEERSDTSIIKT